MQESHETGADSGDAGSQDDADADEAVALGDGSDYVDAVVQLAEASERNYRAAVLAGQVVNGATDSTNY